MRPRAWVCHVLHGVFVRAFGSVQLLGTERVTGDLYLGIDCLRHRPRELLLISSTVVSVSIIALLVIFNRREPPVTTNCSRFAHSASSLVLVLALVLVLVLALVQVLVLMLVLLVVQYEIATSVSILPWGIRILEF